VCLKHKPGRPFQISNELSLKPSERDKDSKYTVIGVEPKGEREFVVLTVSNCSPRANYQVLSMSTGSEVVHVYHL
jgi:hypothetical protein